MDTLKKGESYKTGKWVSLYGKLKVESNQILMGLFIFWQKLFFKDAEITFTIEILRTYPNN